MPNVARMVVLSSPKRAGHTSTPISHDAMRTSPAALVASPQACLDKLADVSSAQSIAPAPSCRMYVLMCGAARLRPASDMTTSSSSSEEMNQLSSLLMIGGSETK